MDDINGLVQVFGNGFFPVIMCVVLLYGIYKFVLMHKDEIKQLTDVINKNTDVINDMKITVQQLSDRLEALENCRKENEK